MRTQIVINGKSMSISRDVIEYKRVASLASCFNPGFVECMKYSHQNGRSGSMGPADRLRIFNGTEFTVT